MHRRAAARKTRHGEVGGAPEKMHRAAFADEAHAKDLEDAIGLHEVLRQRGALQPAHQVRTVMAPYPVGSVFGGHGERQPACLAGRKLGLQLLCAQR